MGNESILFLQLDRFTKANLYCFVKFLQLQKTLVPLSLNWKQRSLSLQKDGALSRGSRLQVKCKIDSTVDAEQLLEELVLAKRFHPV